MELNFTVILAYVIGIILLLLMGRLLLVPMKIVLKLIYNALLGALAILTVNFIGGFFGYHIAFNIITAFVVGLLGVPGLVLIVILKIIFA